MKFQFYQQVLKHISILTAQILFCIYFYVRVDLSYSKVPTKHIIIFSVFITIFTLIFITNVILEIKKFRENYRNQYRIRKD